MQKINLFFAITIVVLVMGCVKNEVLLPDFEVTVNSATFKAGDPVVFNFSGNAENITFYSGEDFAKYENRGKPTLDKAIAKLDFSTATGGGLRTNSLRLFYTTDQEVPTSANVNSLNWIDITDNFTLATTTTALPSGTFDLSDISALNKPVRFGFRYQSKLSATLAHPIWSIRTFNINAIYSDATVVPVASLTTAGWSVIDIMNNASTWVVSATQVREDGGAKNTADQEDWVTTNLLSLNVNRDIYDTGKAIKSINEKRSSYSHTYAKPGTYKVIFVAFNHNINDEKRIVKEMNITIL